MTGDKDAVTYTADDKLVGQYQDIKAYLLDMLNVYLKGEQYDEVRDIADLLNDLWEYTAEDKLIAVSENNGMGLTIEYLNDN